jgi:hypothetical protein
VSDTRNSIVADAKEVPVPGERASTGTLDAQPARPTSQSMMAKERIEVVVAGCHANLFHMRGSA